MFIKNILKAKQSFDEILPSSAQPSEEGGIGITACSVQFEMFGFGFFLLCLGSEFSDIEYLGDRVCKVTFGLGLPWKGKRRFRLQR